MTIDRRRQIVDAAEKSFSLFGYKATTMDQVAKLANVGKGTIYTFFTNKEELFQDIMNRLIEQMRLVAEATVKPERTFFDNLTAVLERLLTFQEKHELALKLSQEVREIGTPMAIEGIEQLEKAIVGYIEQKVRWAVEKGEIMPCDPELTAFVMLKLYMALTVEWKAWHKPLTADQVAQQLRFYLEKGLAPL